MDFIEEMTAYFNANPITKKELSRDIQCEKVTFIDRYDPSKVDISTELERRRKISETMKGRKQHPNSIKNFENKTYWTGKKHSAETRAKMSEARKKRHLGIK
jgi:hypothetical protein